MTFTKLILLYLATALVFFTLDLTWLGLVAKDFYRAQAGQVLRTDVNWGAALLFYTIFIAGILIFVVIPSIEKNSLVHALLFGAAFGFVTYATFDLTALALIRDFPAKLVPIDLMWGVVLTASVSAASHKVAQWLIP